MYLVADLKKETADEFLVNNRGLDGRVVPRGWSSSCERFHIGLVQSDQIVYILSSMRIMWTPRSDAPPNQLSTGQALVKTGTV